MKTANLRKVIREEVRKALNEGYREPKQNVAIVYDMLKKGGKEAQYVKDLFKNIKSELNIVMSPNDPKATLNLATQNEELAEYLDDAVEMALDNGMARAKGMMGGMQGMREESFMENKMSKTKKMVKRLKEDTAYQEFFKKAMDKFKISSPADLKDPAKKKEFFDYVDTNYKAKEEN
jgi:hypothetical protein